MQELLYPTSTSGRALRRVTLESSKCSSCGPRVKTPRCIVQTAGSQPHAEGLVCAARERVQTSGSWLLACCCKVCSSAKKRVQVVPRVGEIRFRRRRVTVAYSCKRKNATTYRVWPLVVSCDCGD
eukprot:2664813-Prymnesium_polylepis.1